MTDRTALVAEILSSRNAALRQADGLEDMAARILSDENEALEPVPA